MEEDGLNSVKYKIETVKETPMYTNITINVGVAEIKCLESLSQSSCLLVRWLCDKFLLSCNLLKVYLSDENFR